MLNIAALLSLSVSLRPRLLLLLLLRPLPCLPRIPLRVLILSRALELLASQVSTLSELFTARLAAPQAVGDFLPASHAPSQARPESDARCPHPVETAGYHQESQALGGSGREPDASGSLPYGQAQLGGDLRASAGLGWASPSASPSRATRQPPLAPGGVFVPPLSAAAPGSRFAPPPPGGIQGESSAHAPPPRFSSAPPGTPRDSGSKDSDSGSSSASAAPDPSAAQLAELVYDFCTKARPVSDSAPPPRCGFESWFDPSPASSSSRPRYRVYPRVDAVESEVADRAAALHRRSKPLSAVLPRKISRSLRLRSRSTRRSHVLWALRPWGLSAGAP